MRPKRDPVPRAREAWRWLGGLALVGVLGGGVAAAAAALWESVDIRQLAPALIPPPSALPVPGGPSAPAADHAALAVVLFNSDRNRQRAEDAGRHDAELDRWRGLVRDAGGTVREADGAVALREVRPDEILLLVEAPCLSAAELGAVRTHQRRGGSLVANWAVGARDGSCDWRGWEPLIEMTGAEAAREMPAREASYMTVPSGVALGAGLDPGTRIETRPDRSIALRMTGPQVFWSDWALNPISDRSGLGAYVGAVATRMPEGGRTAWLGARLGQAASEPDSARLHRLALNGLLWAAGVRSAAPAPWPGAARAALVLALDVEEEPRNAIPAAQLLRRERLPGTFFVVTELVDDDEELREALRGFEVGSQTVDHTPVAGLTPQDQAARLRRSMDDIEAWSGLPASGLRPPEDAFDSVTLAVWRRAGGAYLLARNEGRSASPEVHLTDGGRVVLLPRLLKDDYNVVVQDRTLRSTRIADAFVRDARKMRAIGGVAVITGHTQIMQSASRLEAFTAAAAVARADGDWWIARADEVATWWKARSEVELTFETPGSAAEGIPATSASRAILVHAHDPDAVRGLWIDLVLPLGSDDVVPSVDGRPVDFEATEWGIRVPADGFDQDGFLRITLHPRSVSGPSPGRS